MRPAAWLLLVLTTAGCATLGTAPSSWPETTCAADSAVVGTWTDARLTQVGPAWVTLTLGCDCRYEWRAQLVFMRITDRGVYHRAGHVLRFHQAKDVSDMPYTVEHEHLELEEFPGERHVYVRQGRRPLCTQAQAAAPAPGSSR